VSYIAKRDPNQNRGFSYNLAIQQDPNRTRTVVSFDISGIPIKQLKEATLVLTAHSAVDWLEMGGMVTVHRLRELFVEGNDGSDFDGYGPGVTWNCAEDSEISNNETDCDQRWNGGAQSTEPATDQVLHTTGLTGPVSWNVTQDVLEALHSGETNIQWMVRKHIEHSNGSVLYWAKESAIEGNEDLNVIPRLIVVLESEEQ
jgi:hypothetical protein